LRSLKHRHVANLFAGLFVGLAVILSEAPVADLFVSPAVTLSEAPVADLFEALAVILSDWR